MTSTTLPLSAFFELTKASEPTTKVGSDALNFTTRHQPVLKVVTPSCVEAPIPYGYQSVDQVVEEFERSPQMREELKRARRWVAETVLATKPLTLRTLRLKRGLSQARLAEEIGTQQPYIARVESGHADLRLDTCRRLAVALGVDLNTLDEALQGQGAR